MLVFINESYQSYDCQIRDHSKYFFMKGSFVKMGIFLEIPTEKSEMSKCIYDIYETNHELPRVIIVIWSE